jgi:GNAT superfamily N-acetyltransferase
MMNPTPAATASPSPLPLRIATMTAADVAFAIGLAAAEGWNPGTDDAAAFFAADPEGFLVGYLGDQPVGCISAVSYGGTFGFIGLYIVVPEHRGKGHGIALWRRAIARLARHNIGLDGVPAQQDNYRRSGFRLAYGNARFEHVGPVAPPSTRVLVPLAGIPFAQLAAYDRRFFPASRDAFLRHWIAQPGARGVAAVADGALQGYGVIRPCRTGSKIGPLFAADPAIADDIFRALRSRVDVGAPVYLDVPETNAAALALADRHAMRRVFGTARMYTGEFPDLPLANIFGVTSFELG